MLNSFYHNLSLTQRIKVSDGGGSYYYNTINKSIKGLIVPIDEVSKIKAKQVGLNIDAQLFTNDNVNNDDIIKFNDRVYKVIGFNNQFIDSRSNYYLLEDFNLQDE